MRSLVLTVGALLLLTTAAPAVEKAAIDDAVDRGVAALKKIQGQDGKVPYEKMGATALLGLTLLECGVKDDDKSVKDAAAACRKAALSTTDTYSLSLMILFLDKIDRPEDTPLIEAMIVTLLAGQNAAGGWDYTCPQAFNQQEMKFLTDEANGDTRELKGSRDLSKMPAKGKRELKDVSASAQAKVVIIARGGGGTGGNNFGSLGDNSNTQFATLALWAGRRYGVPTQAALAKIENRYRTTQGKDGTWTYSMPMRINGDFMPSPSGHSAAMTCAGLLGLICGHGAKGDMKKNKDGKVSIDLSNDKNLSLALQSLGTAVGEPVGWKGSGQAPEAISAARDKAYYYLWSLERVCVLLGLETLGKKDWYNWGAEILLKNQGQDGMWRGEYAEIGADTCFALLFLKKVNLMRDLTGNLASLKDPGERKLKSGGVGGGALTGKKVKDTLMPSDIGGKPTKEKDDRKPLTAEQKQAAKLGGELVGARGRERSGLLEKLRDTKGGEYTEALTEVIPKLDAEAKKLAREALADRLTRMKATTLKEYLKEPDPELRRAAAIAIGQKDAKTLIPDLIVLLSDEDAVKAGARASLKAMAGKDLGDNPEAWREWWKKQAKE